MAEAVVEGAQEGGDHRSAWRPYPNRALRIRGRLASDPMAKAKRTKRPKPAAPQGPKPPPLPGPEALRALGIDTTKRPKGDAGWWADARDALDRVEILHAVWRWIGTAGYVPVPEDWDPKEGWPTPSEVDAVFGSWDEMLASAAVEEAISVELLDRAGAAEKETAALKEQTAAKERWFEEQERKLTEIRRQAEAARSKREAAESGRQDAEAAHLALRRERDALAGRVRELEAELDAARAAAPEPEPAEAADAALLEQVESELAAHARTQQQRDELHEHLESVRAEREHDRRTIAELTRLLALAETAAAAAEGEEAIIDSPPASVLQAVEQAAARAQHLRFAPRAFDSAADSPFRRPGLVLRTLRALDEIAGRFAAGEMGASLGQAAAEHGITQWRPGVAETTRKRYADDYTVAWEGHRLDLGPHIGLGSGSGAEFIARIYLHVSDGGEVPRGITVGHVGRHLPDTTT